MGIVISSNKTVTLLFKLKKYWPKLNRILLRNKRPWSRKNAFLARILQDPCKNAITCKILQGNLFLARSCKEMFSLKDLARKCFLERSCKKIFSLKDLARKCFPCKILEFNVFHTEKLCYRSRDLRIMSKTLVTIISEGYFNKLKNNFNRNIMHSLISNQKLVHNTIGWKNFQNTLKLYFKCCVIEMYYYFSNNFTKITLLEIFSRVCIFLVVESSSK